MKNKALHLRVDINRLCLEKKEENCVDAIIQ